MAKAWLFGDGSQGDQGDCGSIAGVSECWLMDGVMVVVGQ